MSIEEKLTIRPYARLITMLGDQLIKDETIAVIELVKNSYDADAECVKICFQNFNSDFSAQEDSLIIIEDDGNGMDEGILKKAWMNPATPEKLKRKREKRITDKGRIMQGEKGIGRFAVFKLGRRIDIISRRQKYSNDHFVELPESEKEYVLKYDFTEYDSDFLQKGNEEKDIYLDELIVSFEERKAEEIVTNHEICEGKAGNRKPYGTKIVISALNEGWNREKIEKVYLSLQRMQPIFGETSVKDFIVDVEVDGSVFIPSKGSIYDFPQILQEKSVFIVDGKFYADILTLKYSISSYKGKEEYSMSIQSSEILGLSPMRSFIDSIKKRDVECGDFSFSFYFFDLDISTKNSDNRFCLDSEEKRIIKAHRVYLYRDGIRVMPYGDPEDDWLKLDTIRGTEKSGNIFGNDQIVGCIKITQAENPKLRDKTNREGLVEDGHAREDLVNICQIILRYLRTKNYAQYILDKKRKDRQREEQLNKPISLIKEARKARIGEKLVNKILSSSDQIKMDDVPKETIAEGQKFIDQFLDRFEQSYRKEVDVLENRISTTENLAAIGLSTETAYHDSRIILQRVNVKFKELVKYYKQYSGEYISRLKVISDIVPLEEQISNVAMLMSNIQKLFPSTKNKKSWINVQQIISTVQKLYGETLTKADIICDIENNSGQALLVEMTDAVLLQVFINLFDNASYWLKTVERDRHIVVEVNAEQRKVVFADSGPGVQPDDVSYIFEAFYSGKGDDGKGLGLYIARQLLGRYDSRIDLIIDDKLKLLEGANFVIQFKKGEE